MESIESFLFEDGLEEVQWADVSPLLKNFNAQWRLAADAHSASKQRVSNKCLKNGTNLHVPSWSSG